MNHLKALSKHYIRRALNEVRYPQSKDQTLFINSWSLQHPLIFIEYEFKGVNYQNKIEFTDLTEDDFKSVDAATLNLLVAHIAIMMSNVFFKIDHINRIECRFAAFGPNWTEFHQYLLSRALGEFKFLQGLSLHHPLTVAGNAVCKTDTQLPPREFNEQCLVMNGGGKDSITSGELAKQAGLPFAWYTVGLNTVRKTVIETAASGDSLSITYKTDSKIGQNAKFSYTPIAGPAFISATALLHAYLKGYKYIVFSNERSADDPNLVVAGVEINHQYSKSLDFESHYRNFAQSVTQGGVHYFSLFRPIYELAIVKIFSQYPKYFDKFISCNIGISKNIWCKKCEKCAFILLCMGAYLDDDEIVRIFGEPLMQNQQIRKHVLRLCSNQTKAWECVGLQDECRLALRMYLDRRPTEEFSAAPYRRDLEKSCADISVPAARAEFLSVNTEGHYVPDRFMAVLKQACS